MRKSVCDYFDDFFVLCNMKVLSVNVAQPILIEYKDQQVTTGYFKRGGIPSIYLGKNGVRNDTVSDLKNHGGVDKACYVYSSSHYPLWKERFPNAIWEWGMFGENITVTDLDEEIVQIGDVFRIGKAVVQVSQPRIPCFKMSFRFGTENIVKEFSEGSSPGVYLRVLAEGEVSVRDPMIKIDTALGSISVAAIYRLMQSKTPDPYIVQRCLSLEPLADRAKNILRKKI